MSRFVATGISLSHGASRQSRPARVLSVCWLFLLVAAELRLSCLCAPSESCLLPDALLTMPCLSGAADNSGLFAIPRFSCRRAVDDAALSVLSLSTFRCGKASCLPAAFRLWLLCPLVIDNTSLSGGCGGGLVSSNSTAHGLRKGCRRASVLPSELPSVVLRVMAGMCNARKGRCTPSSATKGATATLSGLLESLARCPCLLKTPVSASTFDQLRSEPKSLGEPKTGPDLIASDFDVSVVDPVLCCSLKALKKRGIHGMQPQMMTDAISATLYQNERSAKEVGDMALYGNLRPESDDHQVVAQI